MRCGGLACARVAFAAHLGEQAAAIAVCARDPRPAYWRQGLAGFGERATVLVMLAVAREVTPTCEAHYPGALASGLLAHVAEWADARRLARPGGAHALGPIRRRAELLRAAGASEIVRVLAEVTRHRGDHRVEDHPDSPRARRAAECAKGLTALACQVQRCSLAVLRARIVEQLRPVVRDDLGLTQGDA